MSVRIVWTGMTGIKLVGRAMATEVSHQVKLPVSLCFYTYHGAVEQQQTAETAAFGFANPVSVTF